MSYDRYCEAGLRNMSDNFLKKNKDLLAILEICCDITYCKGSTSQCNERILDA